MIEFFSKNKTVEGRIELGTKKKDVNKGDKTEIEIFRPAVAS